jgi:hypothetical protein
MQIKDPFAKPGEALTGFEAYLDAKKKERSTQEGHGAFGTGSLDDLHRGIRKSGNNTRRR